MTIDYVNSGMLWLKIPSRIVLNMLAVEDYEMSQIGIHMPTDWLLGGSMKMVP